MLLSLPPPPQFHVMDELLSLMYSVRADGSVYVYVPGCVVRVSERMRVRVREGKHVHACFVVCVRVCHQ